MGLFGFGGKKSGGKKQTKKNSTKNQTISTGVDLNRLDKDGELPVGWLYANRHFIEPIEAEYRQFSDVWFASKRKGALERYAALKSLVLYMEDIKRLCATKGECFVFWSEILVADPILLEQRKADLKYMEDHMDELLADEKKRNHIEQNIVPKLRGQLVSIIKNEPGLLQSDIYKRFDPELKEYVQSELYAMQNEGLLKKEKSGRSYKLYCTKG